MNYKDKFKAQMKKAGINSLDDLKTDAEKKAFFKAVDKSHDAKNESITEELVTIAEESIDEMMSAEMSEMMKEMMKEMKKKMDEYGSMNINAMKEMAEMKPMNAMKMNAMTDPKKMNAMTMQDPKQDMLKKHSNDDIKAMKKMEMDMAKNNDDTETPSMEMMKGMLLSAELFKTRVSIALTVWGLTWATTDGRLIPVSDTFE